MELKYRAIKGVNDILPDESGRWQSLESKWRDLCRRYGYRDIRTPIFEATELFTRSIGEVTDIVSKEMYTFEDKGGRSLTLKPEGTAPVVRAYLEHHLAAEGGAVKLCYCTPFFRQERPQKGRYRQAHQMGAEFIGVAEPSADAELIGMVTQFLGELGFEQDSIGLSLNTIGCHQCRPAYRDALQSYLRQHASALCATCQDRIVRNPMRALDCKVPDCQSILDAAPPIDPFLCEACSTHFEGLSALMKQMGIVYERNHRLARGFDYYTRTTFEVQGKYLGAQNAICGGGRYDTLVEELGGPPTPALGFGIGVERVLMMMSEMNLTLTEEEPPVAFVVTLGDSARTEGLLLAQSLRQAGLAVEIDHTARSLKAQMRLADKCRARFAILIGDNEIAQGTVALKNLQTHEQRDIARGALIETLRSEAQ